MRSQATINPFANRKVTKIASTAILAFSVGMANIVPSYAAITNDATAYGTYTDPVDATTSQILSNVDSVSVDVIQLDASLTTVISVTAPTTSGGVDGDAPDAGDTITLTYTMTNDGNVTLTGVEPDLTTSTALTNPQFGGQAGTGVYGTPTLVSGTGTLAPGQSLTYEVTYTLTDTDVINANNGTSPEIAVTATATASQPDGGTYTDSTQTTMDTNSPWPSTYSIPDNPSLFLKKEATLSDANGTVTGKAEVGETIVYKYTVKNDGNVALTNVLIKDVHEGATLIAGTVSGEVLFEDGPYSTYSTPVVSSDASANDGTWDVLQPGATIYYYYTHTVTQAEVDAQ